MLTTLRTKLDQFQQAANESLGIFFEVTVDPPGPPPGPSYFPRMEQTLSIAVPGQSFTITARLYNRGNITVIPQGFGVEAAEGWKIEHLASSANPYAPLKAGEVSSAQFKLTVLEDAKYTKPYFTRSNPETETVYSISDPKYLTLPWPPYPVHAYARFTADTGAGEARAVAKIKFIDPTLGQSERPLAVGPPISVLLTSPVAVAPVGGTGKSQIGVSVRSNVQTPVHAKLRLETPQDGRLSPLKSPLILTTMAT